MELVDRHFTGDYLRRCGFLWNSIFRPGAYLTQYSLWRSAPTLPLVEPTTNSQTTPTPTGDIKVDLSPTPTPRLVTPGDPLATLTSPTATRQAPFPFVTQATPAAVDGTLYNPEHDCTWTGVAGQVLDLNGSPAVGIPVRLVGVFNGKYLDITTLTGTASIYGPSGYEFSLGDQPRAT
jgi:hypothetical protein